jgi:multiple sugar transport system permease protein
MKIPRRVTFSYGLLTFIVLLLFTLPFIWMLFASFKTESQIISGEFFFKPTFKNYIKVFAEYDFISYIFNSAVIAVGTTLFSLLLGLPAAYAINKYRMGKLGVLILLSRIIPAISLLIPFFMIFSKLQLIDTYFSLILSHMLIGLPFTVWIMISFFESIPHEIEEAGLIDGCSRHMVFIRIVLPISGPGVITASLLSMIFSWNNFMFSVVLAGENTKTLPIAIFNFMSYSAIDWGGLMAASCIITLPMLLIALVAQRYIVSGLSAGAVKG